MWHILTTTHNCCELLVARFYLFPFHNPFFLTIVEFSKLCTAGYKQTVPIIDAVKENYWVTDTFIVGSWNSNLITCYGD